LAVVLFQRIAPITGAAGRCAVVPDGKLSAPVLLLISTTPPSACNPKLPVASGVIINPPPDDELALIFVVIIIPLVLAYCPLLTKLDIPDNLCW
jgi:hypothetical protein